MTISRSAPLATEAATLATMEPHPTELDKAKAGAQTIRKVAAVPQRLALARQAVLQVKESSVTARILTMDR